MFEKLNLRSEDGIINIVVLSSWIFIMPIIIVLEFQEFAMWALAGFGLVLLGMLGAFLWSRKSSALKGLIRDERTDKYTLKSARNGFLMTIALTGFLTVATFIRGSHIDLLFTLLWIWSWATASYQLSFLYYVMRG